MIDRDKLAALHERATKGEWEIGQPATAPDVVTHYDADEDFFYTIADCSDRHMDGSEDDAALIALLCSESGRTEILAMMDERDKLRDALAGVVRATRAYIPPDGIGAQACLNRILAATDNPEINPAIFAALGE